MIAKGGRGRRGLDWKLEISKSKLLYTEWVNNKVLLCSTGICIQYPVINHNGKENEKGSVCVCVYTMLCVNIYKLQCCVLIIAV